MQTLHIRIARATPGSVAGGDRARLHRPLGPRGMLQNSRHEPAPTNLARTCFAVLFIYFSDIFSIMVHFRRDCSNFPFRALTCRHTICQSVLMKKALLTIISL